MNLSNLSPWPSFLSRDYPFTSSSIPPFNPEEAFDVAYTDGRWCEHCTWNLPDGHFRACSASAPRFCPGARQLAEAYIDFYTDPFLLSELSRRSTSDDLLIAYIAQVADLSLEDAGKIFSAFRFWLTT